MASATLTTVANPWYEVEGGRRVRLTVCYLSRAWRWEAQVRKTPSWPRSWANFSL